MTTLQKYILILVLSVCAVSTLTSQSSGILDISDIDVSTDRENVSVSFEVIIGDKAAPGGTTFIYAPLITDGNFKVSLPEIVVQERRAKINWERHEWAAGTDAVYENGIYTTNGNTLSYTAEVPFQPWMEGARIDIETVTAAGCESHIEIFTLIDAVLADKMREEVEEVEPDPEVIPETPLAQYLAVTLPFVLPASELDPEEPVRFYNDERDNDLTIYYRINRHDIDENYAENRQTLINLTAAIRLIRESGDADVHKVVVVGFASPDGSFEFNDYLAWERAVAIEEYILENTDLTGDDITLFNGSADWHGLRMAVWADHNVPARDEALDIIGNAPLWDAARQTGRQTLLRNLNGGETYRYLSENIFPKLRNGAFIRVYFK